MRKLSAIGVLTGLLLFPTGHVGNTELSPAATAASAKTRATQTDEPAHVVTGVIPRNSTLSRALSRALAPADVHRLVEAARPVYDLARVSVGHPFELATDPAGMISGFTYAIDELKTLRVDREGEGMRAEIVSRDYETQIGTAAGTIDSSLFLAVTSSGENEQLALDLADIFAWDIDFNSELQRGDSFRVAVEKLSLDGRFKRYGRILSAEFTRGDRVLRAVLYHGAAGTGYFSPEGAPLRKAFLRSPLKFTRISSGFTSSRFHPVLGRRAAHYGIDYAAPAGTPVMAASNGVVTLAGWSKGFGKTVRLRHPNGYETLYGHLSRIDVRPGVHVSQGDCIGAVGSTGISTGPHLDYRMMRNGGYINPLKIELPAADPVPAAERALFGVEATKALALLDVKAAPAVAEASAR